MIQIALVWLTEEWEYQLDKNGFAGAILMDLSKAFNTINYDLLTARLYHVVLGKMKNRKQKVKVNTIFSAWTDLISGAPQGFVLGLLLFTNYLNDLFFFLQDINICNFADDRPLLSTMKQLKGF